VTKVILPRCKVCDMINAGNTCCDVYCPDCGDGPLHATECDDDGYCALCSEGYMDAITSAMAAGQWPGAPR
jgi:hypothetical protein